VKDIFHKPRSAIVLTEGAMRTMFLTKLKVATTALLLAGVVIGGAGVLAQQGKTRPPIQQPDGFLFSAEDFRGAKSLKEALEIVKQELIREGKGEYAPLLAEHLVRQATRSGIRTFEACISKAEQKNRGIKDHFMAVKPVFMKIAEEGVWPADCSFFGFYSINSRVVGAQDIRYKGFWLRLVVETPNPKGDFDKFALPILDMAYGMIEP
jgi:hypothetical protein